jgi:uncharacterized protein (UPF0548 family)
MFLLRRPSPSAIDRFLRDSQELPLSYGPVGIVNQTDQRNLDESIVTIGKSRTDFEQARTALMAWKQSNIGWMEIFPKQPPAVGRVVVILARHLGFWSLNACRVLYFVGGPGETHFGFAYGTLTNHAVAGEELFEVFIDEETGDVKFRIRAVSWPHAVLARIGRPFSRWLQARFRRDSSSAMRQLVHDPAIPRQTAVGSARS